MKIVDLSSQDAVWAALDNIVNDPASADDIELQFEKADWPKVQIKLTGESFHHSVPSSVMAGLVEFQSYFYRSVALVLAEGRPTKLTAKQRADFEFIFEVNEGSSALVAFAEKHVGELLKLAGKMSGREFKICVLIIVAAWFTSSQVTGYLAHTKGMKEIEAASQKDQQLAEITKKLVEADAEKTRILGEALKQSQKAQEIYQNSQVAFEAIIRRSGRADTLSIQGIEIPQQLIEEMTKRFRRKAEEVRIIESFEILGVDTQSPSGFTVKVRQRGTDVVITAAISDPIVIDKYSKVIQRAEWGKNPVRLEIVARQIGDAYVDARLVKAWLPRRKKGP